ncbi:response regulator transcription factor [Pelagerythrobacter sp.]|uniref:response regulator transcription factor n=1 Tax=Pelagerythrobacter sp. TaxID=2800702 RepID=UPI0035B2514C
MTGESKAPGLKSARTVHVVGADYAKRNDIARVIFTMSLHAEIYADLAELIAYAPKSGVILYRQSGTQTAGEVMDVLHRAKIGLPVIFANAEPDIDWVVDAVRAGAADCVAWPASRNTLQPKLRSAIEDAARHAEAQRALIDAKSRLESLTPREREVLDWLTKGRANKEIAIELEISPRTVEIHRSNMMQKLRARHVADAVRIGLTFDDTRSG